MTNGPDHMPSDAQTRMEFARQEVSAALLRTREDSRIAATEPQSLNQLQPNLVYQPDTPVTPSRGDPPPAAPSVPG